MYMKKMPGIGLRMIKSSIAVFLCLLLNMLRQGQGVVFYSCIAAVLCMQQDAGSSVRVGKNRVVGTLVGGAAGMLLLALEQQFHIQGTLAHDILVSAGILVIIYVTVLMEKRSASYISCVVFMSIVISHITDEDPYLFALNRILDTLIGIAVSFAVNLFHLPHPRQRDVLFVRCGDRLAIDKEKSAALHAVRVRRLLDEGMKLTCAFPLPPCGDDMTMPFPLIVFGGGALYDERSRRYEVLHQFTAAQTGQLLALLQEADAEAFTFFVSAHVLHVYLPAPPRDAEASALLEALRGRAGYACVIDRIPPEREALMFGVMAAPAQIASLEKKLGAAPCQLRRYACAERVFLALLPSCNDEQEAADLLSARIHAQKAICFPSDEENEAQRLEQMFYRRCDVKNG